MSSSSVKGQTIEEANESNPAKHPVEPRVTGRFSSTSTHARSSSFSGQRSKIPMNITSHAIRAPPVVPPLASETPDESRRVAQLPPANSVLSSRANKSASSNSVGSPSMLKRRLETQFSTKKKRYAYLKRELTEKQKNAADLYNEISQLREKLLTCGARDPGKLETIVLTSVPTNTESSPRAPAASSSVNNPEEDPPLPDLSPMMREAPKRCVEICDEVTREHSEMLEWLEKLESLSDETEVKARVAQQLENHRIRGSNLQSRLEQAKEYRETWIADVSEVVEKLRNEVESSHEKIRQLENARNGMSEKLDATTREKKVIETEIARSKERELASEAELQKLRGKTREMELRVSEDETKIEQLRNSVKNLEARTKQKNLGAEKHLKDMEKSLRNSQSLLAKTEKQRDCFEARLIQLKKHFDSKEKEAESRIAEMSEKLAATEAKLAEERDERQNGETSDARLAERDEKIKALQRQKEEIILTIAPDILANDDDRPKCDDESKSHGKIIDALTKKMQVLGCDSKVARAKNESLERELHEVRSRLHGQSRNNEMSLWSAERAVDLEKQVRDLRSSVQELTRRNEELEIALNQKQLEIEEQDRVTRERSGNVIKVRDEVIDLIAGNAGSRRNHADREPRTSEGTENLQRLYTTLETKQMQITRLEQLVEQMEVQQERAQEQRTRMERKIAQLQLAMHYKKSHRYVSEANKPPFLPDKSRDSTRVPLSPRSSSRPAQQQKQQQPPPRLRRSKTLNSFSATSASGKQPLPTEACVSRITAEIVDALRREREYSRKKRSLAGTGEASGGGGGGGEQRLPPKEDRGSASTRDSNILDFPDMDDNEMRELFYNWLVEPWIFHGASSDDEKCRNRASDRREHIGRAHRPGRSDDRSLSRRGATTAKHCSDAEASKRDSPKYRRRSATDSSRAAVTTAARVPTNRRVDGLSPCAPMQIAKVSRLLLRES